MRRSGLAFDRLCELSGLPRPIPEYRFSPPRRWRFDWAWPNHDFGYGGVALEKQGGLFIQGRHSRGAALLKEHEKLNEAATLIEESVARFLAAPPPAGLPFDQGGRATTDDVTEGILRAMEQRPAAR